MMMSDSNKRFILVATNTITCVAWLRVFLLFITIGWSGLSEHDVTTTTTTTTNDDNDNDDGGACHNTLRPLLFWALGTSTLEFGTCLLGLTGSNPIQVLLFTLARTGTELLVTPLIACGSWQHLATALFWSFGDVIRFGCFACDGLLFPKSSGTTTSTTSTTNMAKAIRYSVGPIMFPLGTLAEMSMVIAAARQGRPWLYVAAALWPVGFFPLMKQLLHQRRKYFRMAAKKSGKAEIKQV